MKLHSVMAVMVMAGTLATAPAVYAAPTAVHTNVHAMFAKTKLVKITLRNDSSTPLKVKAGADEMTLLPGKPVDLKVPSGQTVTAVEASAHYAAGDVIATVDSQLDGATIVIR